MNRFFRRKNITHFLRTPIKFSSIENKLNKIGVYGYKLLGAGSGGYYCIISNQKQKIKLKKIFKKKFLDIKFDHLGAREVKISI